MQTSYPKVRAVLALVVLALAACLLAAPAHAAFPGKDGKIAFVMNDGNDDEIFTMNRDGTGVKQLTDNDDDDDDPSFSPDGERIVFESDRDGGQGRRRRHLRDEGRRLQAEEPHRLRGR